jgi:hypothetical protein
MELTDRARMIIGLIGLKEDIYADRIRLEPAKREQYLEAIRIALGHHRTPDERVDVPFVQTPQMGSARVVSITSGAAHPPLKNNQDLSNGESEGR